MKQNTLGIIGGMSWESTAVYYQLINQGIKAELGGLHSADVLLRSVDFAPIADLQSRGDWSAMAQILADSAVQLKAAGAKGILIATNTMHKVADEVEQACGLPLLHIADATADDIVAQHLGKVALLGTQFTMTQDFYKQKLVDRGIEVIIPNDKQCDDVHRIIYEELCRGEIRDESREIYRAMIKDLANQGAQGVILGCTEIGLLIKPSDCEIPVFDTTAIHAQSAVKFLLGR